MKDIKAFAFEFETKADGDSMIIEGYGSTFGNVDHGGDIVERGAFSKSLGLRMPKMLWQHDARQVPGLWEAASEDTKGLYLKGRFINTPLGRDVYEHAKEGAIDTMSIGYSVKQESYDADKKTRSLKEVALYEVSLVTFPMNEQARIVAVKAVPTTLREFEELLRDAGYSHQQAKHIAKMGFNKEADDLRDAADAALVQDLTNLANQLKGSHHGTLGN
jgi:HK97 family phage prohead protease